MQSNNCSSNNKQAARLGTRIAAALHSQHKKRKRSKRHRDWWGKARATTSARRSCRWSIALPTCEVPKTNYKVINISLPPHPVPQKQCASTTCCVLRATCYLDNVRRSCGVITRFALEPRAYDTLWAGRSSSGTSQVKPGILLERTRNKPR